MWDKKSKSYSKFNGDLTEFGKEFFHFLYECGLNFTDKSVVDVGCGTGVYTLYIAKFAKEILGVDSSQNMLAELKNSAKSFNITNVKTILGTIEDLEKSSFDIAFLTMSPALNSSRDFKLFCDLAPTRIYMNWAQKRSSSLLDPLFEKYGKKESKFSVYELENFLDNNDIKYREKSLRESRSVQRSIEKTYENLQWHLEINNINLAKTEVITYLQKLAKDDVVTENIKTSMKILVF